METKKTFYNTTNESGQLLIDYREKAGRQETIILSLFRKIREGSPWDIYEIVGNMPITSVRRALTNLTKKGCLIKTGLKKEGAYGRPEYIWKIK